MQIEETTQFQPQVRGEVGGFAWHYVAHLPASEEASMHYNNTEEARHRFFQVLRPCAPCLQFAGVVTWPLQHAFRARHTLALGEDPTLWWQRSQADSDKSPGTSSASAR